MRRSTKIVATLGPATDDPLVLRGLIGAGVDVVRLNYSHGAPDDHARRALQCREIASELGRDIAVLCDLQGPKIRIEGFTTPTVELNEGRPFALDTALDPRAGNVSEVGCSYTDLPNDVASGDVLLLNDGAISLRVERVAGTRIDTTVISGGVLSARKGINRQGGGLTAPALTDKDKADIVHAARIDADFIAVSFPRRAADMEEARQLATHAGSHARLVAKIERREALEVLDALVAASDAVMVARGDLGVEIGDAELPGWQKRIIATAREMNRVVITATQMMESMIQNPIPTRAEVLDVANAVMDGTDAVMLSAETASGKHPVKVVETIARVCVGAEQSPPAERKARQFSTHFRRIDEAIAMATTWTADHMHADAIIALTESGETAMMMSRSGIRIPIYAMTGYESTRRRMCLCGGVYPVAFEPSQTDSLAPVREAIATLVGRGYLSDGDRVMVTRGDYTGPGGTNAMKIVTVGKL